VPVPLSGLPRRPAAAPRRAAQKQPFSTLLRADFRVAVAQCSRAWHFGCNHVRAKAANRFCTPGRLSHDPAMNPACWPFSTPYPYCLGCSYGLSAATQKVAGRFVATLENKYRMQRTSNSVSTEQNTSSRVIQFFSFGSVRGKRSRQRLEQ
jgi:hypothetical protein